MWLVQRRTIYTGRREVEILFSSGLLFGRVGRRIDSDGLLFQLMRMMTKLFYPRRQVGGDSEQRDSDQIHDKGDHDDAEQV